MENTASSGKDTVAAGNSKSETKSKPDGKEKDTASPSPPPTVKAKKTKSRNGCLTCKKKRLKCGEEKPFCLNCVRKNIVCGGYSMNFKWRDFSQTSTKMSRDSSVDSTVSSSTTNKFKSEYQELPNPKKQKIPLPNQTQPQHSLQQVQFQGPLPLHQQHQMLQNQFLQHNPQLNPNNQRKHQQQLQESKKNEILQQRTQDSTKTKQNQKPNSKIKELNVERVTEDAGPSQSATGNSSSVLQKALEAATMSVTGKSTQEIAIANALIASGKNPDLAAAIASTLNGLVSSVEKQQLELQQRNSISPPDNQTIQEPQSQWQQQIHEQIQNLKDTKSNNNTVSPSNLSKASSSPDGDSTISAPGSNKEKHESKRNVDHGIETSLDDESRNSLLSSLADVASRVPPSPPSGMSLFSVQSPADMLFPNQSLHPHTLSQQPQYQQQQQLQEQQQQPQGRPNKDIDNDNIPSPLNMFKDTSGVARSPLLMPFTPGNPLYEVLNNATTSQGQLDSPKLLAQLSENPAAMEQYQHLLTSPALSSYFRVPVSPNTAPSPLPSHLMTVIGSTSSTNSSIQNKPGMISPSFSTLINAFTNFDAPSPANFELLPHSPGVEPTQKSKQKKQQEFNQVIMPGSILQEQQSPMHYHSALNSPSILGNALVKVTTAPDQAVAPQLPRTIELNDQTMKMISAFDRYTCGIMSMKNGPTENPWRTLMLPLSQEYPVMLNAISAMTCFHVARGDAQLRSQGMKHMKNAIVELVHGLSEKTTPPDVALATCLALAMGEAWDRHVSTGIAHLKGARTMILQVLNNLQYGHKGNYITVGDGDDTESDNRSRSSSFSSNHSGSVLSSNSERGIPRELQFLVHAWVYFDVLARMTSDGDGDEVEEQIEELEDGFSSFHGKESDSDESSRPRKKKSNESFTLMERFQSFNLAQGDEVDPLLGVGQKLFPVIGNVASLIAKVRKENKNSLSIVSKAVELKKELESWKPPSLKNFQIEDPLFDLASAVATAEAYRHATLLYLHQAVPEIPSRSSHAIAEQILMLLASIPTSSRTCVTHIFPLLIASCEAKQGEERDWVKKRWELLSSKMWIGNIDRALEVVKEVWSRKDLLKRKSEQDKYGGGKDTNDDGDEDDQDIAGEFVNLSKRISECINGGEDGDAAYDNDNRLKSWTHWATVMKDWGWEVLLA